MEPEKVKAIGKFRYSSVLGVLAEINLFLVRKMAQQEAQTKRRTKKIIMGMVSGNFNVEATHKVYGNPFGKTPFPTSQLTHDELVTRRLQLLFFKNAQLGLTFF